ncbi:hypothetical protein QE450_004532 [Paenibacillus sp. SORGH_AS306]|uniref:hypothetical protein n=1 Tax=Paenibacillus sp. SORGH_AS_0306 TaxID=3041754 RepID=UPI00278B11A8|nr:hypothetical protein [Paenibacillus sp. SORGH_AS_0306]MDQ1237034.1 hypothetical protein [Paenibacillus sp. SORGH_AS_0306]
MRNQNVLNEQWMQKRNGVKTFFHKLSVDPSLKQEKEGNKDFDVNEWLEMATSPLPEEISPISMAFMKIKCIVLYKQIPITE